MLEGDLNWSWKWIWRLVYPRNEDNRMETIGIDTIKQEWQVTESCKSVDEVLSFIKFAWMSCKEASCDHTWPWHQKFWNDQWNAAVFWQVQPQEKLDGRRRWCPEVGLYCRLHNRPLLAQITNLKNVNTGWEHLQHELWLFQTISYNAILRQLATSTYIQCCYTYYINLDHSILCIPTWVSYLTRQHEEIWESEQKLRDGYQWIKPNHSLKYCMQASPKCSATDTS